MRLLVFTQEVHDEVKKMKAFFGNLYRFDGLLSEEEKDECAALWGWARGIGRYKIGGTIRMAGTRHFYNMRAKYNELLPRIVEHKKANNRERSLRSYYKIKSERVTSP